MGRVTLGGQFEAGSSVSLFRVEGDHVMRAEHGTRVGRRLADAKGSVGFDGLEVDGSRLIATGFDPFGNPTEVRCIAVKDEDDVTHLAQPPLGEAPMVVGTQEAVVHRIPPAAPSAILQVGVPAAVAA